VYSLRTIGCVTALLGAILLNSQSCGASDPVENIILITMDGLRWQELFGGLDETMLGDKENGTKDPKELNRHFAAETPEERRVRLMPFFWNVIAKQGVVFGDQEDESHIRVSNGMNFSYPGYSEILCGFPDARIDSNAKINNLNVTILEWLNHKDRYPGQVAAFSSWDVFPWIINTERSGVPVNAGWMPLADPEHPSPELGQLDILANEIPHYWAEVRYDIFTFAGARHYLQEKKPKVLYVSLGETDDWAHSKRYDLYLDSAKRNDDYIRRLWETAQSMPEYQDRTALVITTDHGRGDDRISWRSHGDDIGGSDRIWAAVLSPTVDPTSDVVGQFTQSQIAATIAKLLGHDYNAAVAKAGAPLPLKWR
jgi:hypothetical protein